MSVRRHENVCTESYARCRAECPRACGEGFQERRMHIPLRIAGHSDVIGHPGRLEAELFPCYEKIRENASLRTFSV
jgi:hypothetical protein